MHLTIRGLQESDTEPLSIIEAQSFSMPWSAQAFADLLKHDYSLYLVAEADGRVAGCAGMSILCNEGNIDNVVVAEAFRGRGIAQKLLEELFRRGEERGVESYTLEVRESNHAAIHIYEKLGFKTEGIRPGFYEKPTENAWIMWKR